MMFLLIAKIAIELLVSVFTLRSLDGSCLPLTLATTASVATIKISILDQTHLGPTIPAMPHFPSHQIFHPVLCA
jgi:hypothetical protein